LIVDPIATAPGSDTAKAGAELFGTVIRRPDLSGLVKGDVGVQFCWVGPSRRRPAPKERNAYSAAVHHWKEHRFSEVARPLPRGERFFRPLRAINISFLRDQKKSAASLPLRQKRAIWF